MKHAIHLRLAIPAIAVGALLVAGWGADSSVWGRDGHLMVGRVAAENLPAAMPPFFRQATDQLAWLNVEPDRWKDRTERDLDPALNGAYSPGHYINLEAIPDSALEARDRLAFIRALQAAGIDHEVGYLPYTILELTQRLRSEFRRWRATPAGPERGWIEQRIINDAGILGHYVADGSEPLHTTVHFNGWVGDSSLGYATDHDTHRRVESDYVRARISLEDLRPLVATTPRAFEDLRGAIWSYLRESNGTVEELYRIDRAAPFTEHTTAPANKLFIVARLVDGADMLRDLWWTAWSTSEPAADGAD